LPICVENLQSVDLGEFLAKCLINGWHPWLSSVVAEKRATS
jgi:hypothetical protein